MTLVGWVERSDTQQKFGKKMMGIALNPSYRAWLND